MLFLRDKNCYVKHFIIWETIFYFCSFYERFIMFKINYVYTK